LSFDKTKDYWRITHFPVESDYELVKINEDDYNSNLIDDVNVKFYIKKEPFELSSEAFNAETKYFIYDSIESKYKRITIDEEEYNNYFIDGLSTKYYIKNSKLFDLSSEPFDETIPYFIYNPRVIEKDNDGKWDIDPIQEKFYEPNKYYYFSKTSEKD
jgi:hypothetical protein